VKVTDKYQRGVTVCVEQKNIADFSCAFTSSDLYSTHTFLQETSPAGAQNTFNLNETALRLCVLRICQRVPLFLT
jgi:hypothetical protein